MCTFSAYVAFNKATNGHRYKTRKGEEKNFADLSRMMMRWYKEDKTNKKIAVRKLQKKWKTRDDC